MRASSRNARKNSRRSPCRSRRRRRDRGQAARRATGGPPLISLSCVLLCQRNGGGKCCARRMYDYGGVRRGPCGERDREAIPLVVRIASARGHETISEGREMMARQCRILVIEDNEHVSALLHQGISLEGYELELLRPPLYDIACIDFAASSEVLMYLLLPRGHDGFAMAQ